MKELKYHLVSIRVDNGQKTYLTKYPDTHKDCMTIKSKRTNRPFRRIQVEEVVDTK